MLRWWLGCEHIKELIRTNNCIVNITALVAIIYDQNINSYSMNRGSEQSSEFCFKLYDLSIFELVWITSSVFLCINKWYVS